MTPDRVRRSCRPRRPADGGDAGQASCRVRLTTTAMAPPRGRCGPRAGWRWVCSCSSAWPVSSRPDAPVRERRRSSPIRTPRSEPGEGDPSCPVPCFAKAIGDNSPSGHALRLRARPIWSWPSSRRPCSRASACWRRPTSPPNSQADRRGFRPASRTEPADASPPPVPDTTVRGLSLERDHRQQGDDPCSTPPAGPSCTAW